MRKWLYDNPWIWVVVFLATLVAGSVATVIIAEINKPEVVRPKEPPVPAGAARLDASSLLPCDAPPDEERVSP